MNRVILLVSLAVLVACSNTIPDSPTTTVKPQPQLKGPSPVPSRAPTATSFPTSVTTFPLITLENAAHVVQIAKLGEGTVGNFTWSPDGKAFVVRTTGGIHLYDAVTLNKTKAFALDQTGPAFLSPDGRTMALAATGTLTGSLQFFDITTGELLRTIPLGERVAGLTFSPDWSSFITVHWDSLKIDETVNNTFNLWDTKSGQLLRVLEDKVHPVSQIVYSSDGRNTAVGVGNDIQVRDVSTGRLIHTLSGHSDTVLEVAFTHDGAGLVSASRDGTVGVWDTATGQMTRSFILRAPDDDDIPVANLIGSHAFSSDGKMIAVSVNALRKDKPIAVHVWSVETGSILHSLDGELGLLPRITFSPDRQLLAINNTRKNDIRFVDLNSGQTVRALTFEGHASMVNSIAFSPAGDRLTSSSIDGTARLWNVSTGQVLHTLEVTPSIDANSVVAFSPDGKLLVSGGQRIQLWDAATGQLLNRFEGEKSVAYHPDGTRLAFATHDNMIVQRSLITDEVLSNLQGHSSKVTSVVYSMNGSRLATADSNGLILLWIINTDSPPLALKAHTAAVTSLAFSPNGRVLVSGGMDETIRVLDTETGQQLRTLTYTVQKDRLGADFFKGVASVAFSPDAKTLASAGDMIRLWNVETGELIKAMQGDPLRVQSVTFSPDGRILGSGGLDGTIRLWGIKP